MSREEKGERGGSYGKEEGGVAAPVREEATRRRRGVRVGLGL